ncbi:ABC transporter ATP-binding protein [Pusillimonas caeni]|uniref:ABC transporter ATP-binding protein n=1 Tax=Pusillimonas caeni TaxID=1348472 RepID=UPI000E599FAC|nr:ABC transporter ATP-binding protein [Pusillimonas caeni]TFL10289.1 ABC transporter ATP-binding protein [Pusillimonas caeni]
MTPLLSVDNVSIKFGGLVAVADASFRLHAGQICALIGPNGAGKSTLFNAVNGFVPTAGGTIQFDGQDVAGMRPDAIARMGMKRTFQNGGVFGSMTVLENVLTGLHVATRRRIVGNALGLRSAKVEERASIERAREILRALDIEELADVKVDDLASGQQRLVEIGRALAQKAKLILLDEPAVGLSASDRVNLGDLLRRLALDGIGILLVEHVLDLVMSVSDRIIVLNHGEIIADDTPERIKANPLVLEAYLGNE